MKRITLAKLQPRERIARKVPETRLPGTGAMRSTVEGQNRIPTGASATAFIPMDDHMDLTGLDCTDEYYLTMWLSDRVSTRAPRDS
jgi:hypothetical protein